MVGVSIDPIDGGSPNNYDYAAQNPINDEDVSGLMPVKEEAYNENAPTTNSAQDLGCFAYSCENPALPYAQGGHCGWCNKADAWIKKHEAVVVREALDDCVQGAFVGAFTGPQDAVLGCATNVALQFLERSPNPEVRYFAYTVEFAGFVRDIRNVETYYERIDLLLKERR